MKNKKNIQILVIGFLALIVAALLGIFISQNESKANKNAASSSSSSSTSSSAAPVALSVDGKVKDQAALENLTFPQLSPDIAEDEAEVEIETSAGNITIKLFPKLAPLAVENFLALAKEQYYNNNEFFRVIKDFMIQSGDPSNTGTGTKSVVNGNKSFSTEISNQLYNLRGALALANTGSPDSSSSQFFIVQNTKDVSSQLTSFLYPEKIKEAYKTGGSPSLDGSYTVFGQVVSGMDVVDKIASGEVGANASSNEQSKPKTPYSITAVKVLRDWDFSAK